MKQPSGKAVLTNSAKKRFASPEPQSNETFKPVVNKKSEQMLRNRGAGGNIVSRLHDAGER